MGCTDVLVIDGNKIEVAVEVDDEADVVYGIGLLVMLVSSCGDNGAGICVIVLCSTSLALMS